MIQYSVLSPFQSDAAALQGWLPELRAELDCWRQPFELVALDYQPNPEAVSLDGVRGLRLLRSTGPAGLSAALAAGIAAARGRLVLAVQGNGRFPASALRKLVQGLTRADFVAGQRRLGLVAKNWQRLARVPRGVLLGLDVRDSGCLCWAARREAVAGEQLARGMYRYLPALVSARGYRVAEAYIDHRRECPALTEGWPNPGDLLAAWWLCRRRKPTEFAEVTSAPRLQLVASDGHLPTWRETA